MPRVRQRQRQRQRSVEVIRNQWYAVLDSCEVGREPVGLTRMGERLVFWRDGSEQVSCLKDQCIHRGAALSIGKIVEDRLQCPFHGFEYDATGRVRTIPAYGRKYKVPEHFKLSGYATHEAYGFIFIYWGDEEPETGPRFFEDLDGSFTYGQIKEVWGVHYSRAIENQLDVVHLRFVHASTIGRGNRSVIDGPLVQWIDDDRFLFYVYNRLENGTIARKPEEMPAPDPNRDFKLSFLFPNLWQNYIGEKARVMAAFVPIDENHTMIYLRFYQKFIRISFITPLLNNIAMLFNRRILHQDRRVVLTQEPKKTLLKGNEMLIQGDRPIIEYRKRRHELLLAAGHKV
jgi:phenylpropionate dioxygenase-like ring-hydroxylating dioxygenase large terminal subunit